MKGISIANISGVHILEALTYAALLAVSSPKTGLELLKQMPVVSLQIYSPLAEYRSQNWEICLDGSDAF